MGANSLTFKYTWELMRFIGVYLLFSNRFKLFHILVWTRLNQAVLKVSGNSHSLNIKFVAVFDYPLGACLRVGA